MASWTLDQIPEGQRVFIDASIFIYHFTGASPDCQDLLEDCERGRISGFTSVTALAEVAHRLMTVEAVAKGLVSPGNVVRKLREKPTIVRELHAYQDQVELIPLMGIAVLDLDLEILSVAAGIRYRYGLLVNDSLLAAAAISQGIVAMASGDPDFERVEQLRLFRPTDL
ncbi:MAG: PIN domain-containing protein [Acidobacteria bacterium]|nr:PIN domain-containing protein [Acidobacteriota bacterium]